MDIDFPNTDTPMACETYATDRFDFGTTHNFKLTFIGDGGTGKTTYIRRHILGDFETFYNPTIGANVSRLTFTTNKGNVAFICWDIAGQEKFGGLKDGYYIGTQLLMIFFDVTLRSTYKHVPNWLQDYDRTFDSVPTVVVGNKIDLLGKMVIPERDRSINYNRKVTRLHHIFVSAKDNTKFERPFLYLLRQVWNSHFVYFTEEPALVPPNMMFEDLSREEIDRLLAKAKKTPLPDEFLSMDI